MVSNLFLHVLFIEISAPSNTPVGLQTVLVSAGSREEHQGRKRVCDFGGESMGDGESKRRRRLPLPMELVRGTRTCTGASSSSHLHPHVVSM